MAKVVSRPRFSVRSYEFNSCRDMQEVEQFGFVNLAEAFEKGIVPSTIDETEVSYNNVTNPGTLISHASDVFDGLRKAEYVRRTLTQLVLNKSEREAAEKQVEKSVAAAGTPGSQSDS